MRILPLEIVVEFVVEAIALDQGKKRKRLKYLELMVLE